MTTKSKKTATPKPTKKSYRNHSNYDYKKVKGEINNEESQTVPDMTLSIKQLLNRYQRGQSIPQLKAQYAQMDDNVPYPIDLENLGDLTKMDRFEKMELAEKMKENVDALQKQITIQDQIEAEAQKKEAYDKEISKRVEARIAEQNKKPSTPLQTPNKDTLS